MGYLVRAGQQGGVILAPENLAEEVLQNVAVILSTPKGSVPLDREFGVSQEYIDKPMPAAVALLTAAVGDAIEEFEPRAKVVGVTVEIDRDMPGRLVPIVEVELSDE